MSIDVETTEPETAEKIRSTSEVIQSIALHEMMKIKHEVVLG
jgi:hypothetical protein